MSAAAETVADATADLAEGRLYDAAEAIERMGLTGKKSPRWLKDQARADRLYYTPVGKTLMWSAQDIRDNITRMRHKPRNAFRP
jgi:hypothetical protein